MFFDEQTLWSINNNNNFQGDGIYMNAVAETFSLGQSLWFDDGDGHLGDLTVSGDITNPDGDYLINENGFELDAPLEGVKTPPGQIYVPKTVHWMRGPLEAGRIASYFEDSTPTLNDGRLGLTAGEGDGLIYFDANTHSSKLSLQEEETRTVSGSGEQSLTVGAPVVAVNAPDDPRICRINLDDLNITIDGSFTIVLINRGSGSFHLRDFSTTSFTGANIRTPAHDSDFQIFEGARVPITYWNGNYHVGQNHGA